MPEKTRTLKTARKRPVRLVYGRPETAVYLSKCRCRAIVEVPVGGSIVTCVCGERLRWPPEPLGPCRVVVLPG